MNRFWWTATAFLAACGEPAADGAGPPVRRDSAGVEIVDNIRTLAGLPVWRVDSTPLILVGGDTTNFEIVAGARQLTDGSIMVSDVRAAEVKLFDSTGAFLKVLGRRGQGPGEFDRPGPPMRLGGDTVYLIDQSRVTLFSGPNLVATTFTPQRPRILIFPMALVATDTAVGMTGRFDQPQELGVRYRTSIAFVRFTMAGVVADTIAVGKGSESYTVSFREGGTTGVGGNPVAMGSQTRAAVFDRRFYLAETGEPEFTTFDLLRRSMRKVRWAAPPDPVTPADKRDYFVAESTDLAANRVGGPTTRAMVLNNLRQQIFAQHGPYYTDFLPTDDGGVWLEQYSRPWRPARRYLAFDSTGTLLARVELPPRVRPFQILGDHMIGRWRNEDDVDHVRGYRIQK